MGRNKIFSEINKKQNKTKKQILIVNHISQVPFSSFSKQCAPDRFHYPINQMVESQDNQYVILTALSKDPLGVLAAKTFKFVLLH